MHEKNNYDHGVSELLGYLLRDAYFHKFLTANMPQRLTFSNRGQLLLYCVFTDKAPTTLD